MALISPQASSATGLRGSKTCQVLTKLFSRKKILMVDRGICQVDGL
jgi:hypothetical protein